MFRFAIKANLIVTTHPCKDRNIYKQTYMKKIYTVIAMAFAVATVWAQTPATSGLAFVPRTAPSATTGSLAAASGKHYSAANVAKKADTTLPDASQIISTQPEGTLYADMIRDCKGFNDGYEKSFVAYAGDIVISKDQKKVYIKNFCPTFPTGWIEGDMNADGLVEFKFPQVVYHQTQDASGQSYELTEYAWKVNVDRENYKINLDEESQTVQFKWDGAKLSQVNSDDVIAMCDESGKFAGYGSYANEFSVMSDKQVTPDASLQKKSYTMTYVDYLTQAEETKTVQVAIDGNDIYLGGFYNDSWIKGTISGNKATFPAYQYLGTETITNKVHEYMIAFEINDDRTEAKLVDNLELDYYPTSGALETTTQSFGVNQGKQTFGLLAVFERPSFEYNNYVVGTPAKPRIYGAMAYDAEEGVAAVAYTNSNLTVDGKKLDKDKIFYNIYLDGKLQTFTTADYAYIAADMTDVPYAYVDVQVTQSSGATGYDFMVNGNQQYVYFYKDFDTFGIKAIYVDGDTRLESEMTEYDMKTASGISNAVADDAAEKSATYYDVCGRKVSAPVKGVYLKTVKLNNGSVKTMKVVVK